MKLNKLPKKRCVRQNKEEINDWANRNKQTTSVYTDLSGYHLFHFPTYETNHLYSSIRNGYTEISFSDFERLVLKKKVNYEIYY